MTTFVKSLTTFLRSLRKYLPDEFVNYCYHLPKAALAVVWHGYPAKEMVVIGITGTDGKTTTTNIVFHILKSAGLNVAMISTVKAVIGSQEYDTGLHVTNPDSWQLQGLIKEAKNTGVTHLVLEVTSHGLMQYRNLGANISVGVITNISHEHLDYHKTMRSYVLAKARILAGVKYSILNRDDRNFRTLVNKSSGRIFTFSLKKNADYTLKKFPFKTKLYGEFNKYNCLAAIAVAKTLGISDSVIRKSVASFAGVAGRMEEVKNKRGIKVFIDFAHKPNALENVLKTGTKITKGRTIAVFGSAGLRDVTKRPVMGEISGRLAGITVITAEDPRTENVTNIIRQIARGCAKSGAFEVTSRNYYRYIKKEKNRHYFIRIPDRAKAIYFTINKLAERKDLIIFCGKGHEKSMCFGTKEFPWNERAEILKAFSANDK